MTLPQPQAASRNAAPANWPKDPDEAQRKAMAASPPVSYEESRRQLTPTRTGQRAAPRPRAAFPTTAYPQPGTRSRAPPATRRTRLQGRHVRHRSGVRDRRKKSRSSPASRTAIRRLSRRRAIRRPSPNFAYGVGQSYKDKGMASNGQDPARGGVAQQ